MPRTLHFGVVRTPKDQPMTAFDVLALKIRLGATHFEVHGSHTEMGEPLQGGGDAVHVVLTVPADLDVKDVNGISQPVAPGLAATMLVGLESFLGHDYRAVDYVTDSTEVWGEDERIHGRWSLTSISGKRL